MAEDYEQSYVYVVYRIDHSQLEILSKQTVEAPDRESRWREHPWDLLVKIKEVFTNPEHAEQEVARLNELNKDKGCHYFWQGARYYPAGCKAQQTQDTD